MLARSASSVSWPQEATSVDPLDVAETEVTNTRECLIAFARRYSQATFAMETDN